MLFAEAQALVWPLWGRLIRGEGGLWLIAISLYATGDQTDGFWLTKSALAGMLLWSLYLFNDLVDLKSDRENPRKNRQVAETYARYQPVYWSVWLFVTVSVLFAYEFMTSYGFAGAAVAIASNCIYSLKLKSTAWLDLLVVGIWGSAYCAIATSDFMLCGVVGIMTMVAHTYQIHIDRRADAAQGITTTAVKAPYSFRLVISLLSMGLGVWVASAGMDWPLILMACAIALPCWVFGSQAMAWHGSRIVFGVLWIVLLLERRAWL